MKNFYKRKTYEGFSLIEMLITMVILGFIMLISALVLTTLLKVSVTSTNKARVRTNSEYVLELLRRTIRTTNPDYVHVYKSSGRTYNANTGDVVIPRFEDNVHPNFREINYSTETGNEIHIKPNNSEKWICLAYYKSADSEDKVKGYILKTYADNLKDHSKCFDVTENPSHNYMVLNTRFVSVDDFKIKVRDTVESNKIIQLDITSSAVFWYFGKDGIISRSFNRQAIVKTEGVIW